MVDTLSKWQSLADAAQMRQKREIEISQLQKEQEDALKITEILRNSPDLKSTYPKLKAIGNVKLLMDADEHFGKMELQDLQITKAKFDSDKARRDMISEALLKVQAQPPETQSDVYAMVLQSNPELQKMLPPEFDPKVITTNVHANASADLFSKDLDARIKTKQEERAANKEKADEVGGYDVLSHMKNYAALRNKSVEELTPKERIDATKEAKNVTDNPATEPTSLKEYNAYVKQVRGSGGKAIDYDAWLTRDANRKKPTTNVFLNQLRELSVADKTQFSEGQVINKATQRPATLTTADATKISDFQSLLGQTKVVEDILKKGVDTGAVKGWVMREGIMLPVVQDNMTKDQINAVTEISRLVNSYIYAVSGKQINEQEFPRISRTAPNLLNTPEANAQVIENFKRYAQGGLDNYLKVHGWAIAGAPTGSGAAPPATDLKGLSDDDLLKLLVTP